MQKTFCSIKVLAIVTLVLFVIFVTITALAFFGTPLLVASLVQQSVQLKEGTAQWDRYVELPFSLDFKTWLFNVTNPEEIMNNGTPVFQEIGPYHYRENVTKDILYLNSDDDTVTYKRNTTFTFDDDLSAPFTEDDEITFLNPIMLSITQMTSTIERMALGGCLDRIFPEQYNNVFIKVKVRNLLFEGIEFGIKNDDIGVACNIVRNQIIEKTANIKNIDKVERNGEVYALRFSLYNYRESLPDGIYNVIRGIRDITRLGHINMWENSHYLTYWGRTMSINNETCNRVRGTDSTIYPPDITKDSIVEILNTDICRVIKITYEKQETYKGINGYHFGTNENTFRSDTENPENDCFCVQQTLDADGLPNCYLDGIIDLQPCTGVPILLSFPHFLFADEKYRLAVKGLGEPDESIHKIFLLVEPNTGTPLRGKKRVQFNMVLRPASFLSFTENLPRLVFPMFWVEEGIDLPQSHIDLLNDEYFSKLKLLDGVRYAMVAVTLAAVVTSTGFLIRKQFFTGK